MSSAPSTSVADDVRATTDIRKIKETLRLELPTSLTTFKRHQDVTTASDLFSLFKSSALGDFEKIIADATPLSSPTVNSFMNPKEVSIAQQSYAQGFLDTLKRVQHINKFIPTSTLLNSPGFVPSLINNLGAQAASEQTNLTKSPISPSRDSPLSVIMAMSMGNMYNFQSLTSPLAYNVSQPLIVPSTSTVSETTLPTNTETLTPPPSGSVADNFYELYTSENNNNDTETCSSSRSNASPQSRNEQTTFLRSFSSDRNVDMGEQEKLKLERKRARNREAASKCRQRKIQKIDNLKKEVKVQEGIKKSNEQKLNELESIVKKLNHIVQEHQTQGCQIAAK